MATLSRLSRSEEHNMSKGIIHSINNAAPLGSPGTPDTMSVSDEQPTLADLVLPGTGHNFSDEFACLLRVLGGARESA
jgi:hypothetical protein